MKNDTLNSIKEFALNQLKQKYGFCGVAENDDMAVLNSSDHNGLDFKIVIEQKPE
jgi:hypothetical protein